MLQDLGREPTPDELARELDMPVEKVQEVQKYGREPISLHTPLGEDGDSEFGDLIEDTDAIAPSDAVAFSLLQEQFRQVLETLSPREAGVIKMRYGWKMASPRRSTTLAACMALPVSVFARSSRRPCRSCVTRLARRRCVTSLISD